MTHTTNTRRHFLRTGSTLAAATAVTLPALVRAQAPLRVGYVNTLAVNAQMWLDIGCGSNKGVGCVGMDRLPFDGVDVVFDFD